MNIATAKRQIADTVEAYLEKDEAGMYRIAPSRQRPIFLVGAPGIGKTAVMEQVAQELSIGIVSYSMTHHTRQSALGLPRIEHREFEGVSYEASEYTMSEIVASIYDYMEKTGLRRGILFLDEINCVSETLHPAMLQFLQFKTFGRHRVPKDWAIVCAGNPPEYNKSVHEFDIVTLDRLREIDVEPDYAAWKHYAQEKGLHSAVTTFLESKPDCFYKVESRPGGGKSFVTARGWEDLAETIAVYERMDKMLDRDLFAQFLRDDEVADAFSTYYALFDKYRSDYQVGRILEGGASEEVKERARAAAFDERVALIGLVLDALSVSCAAAVEHESAVLELRDVLRDAKPALLAGKSVAETVGEDASRRLATLRRHTLGHSAGSAKIRHERVVLNILRDLEGLCAKEQTLAGEAAFATLQGAYTAQVEKISTLAGKAGGQLDCAFDFLDECFGDGREMLVFTAELATRASTASFLARYGNEKYYAHSDELQVDATRVELGRRLAALGEFADEGAADGEGDAGGEGDDGHTSFANERVGLAPTTSVPPTTSAPAAQAQAQAADDEAKKGTGTHGVRPQTLGADAADLAAFYDSRQFEWGFAGVCKMTFDPAVVRGKTVLDIGCRRGMGVYKFSAKVGNDGRAIGIDWSPSFIDEARAGMERAWRDSGLKKNNMEFHVAYPEDLMAAGIGDSTIDVVYINNVITLLADPGRALAEFARVLRPNGLFVCETVFADRERDEVLRAKAKDIGNSVQAAGTEAEFLDLLKAAGFGDVQVKDSYPVAASRGYTEGTQVETVPGDDGVEFRAMALDVKKA